MKTCNSCRETKPKSEFHKETRKKDGLSLYCKKCASAKSKKWSAEYSKRNKVVDTTGEKTCFTCKESKPRTEFTLQRRNKDGLCGYCKSCESSKQKKWRDENRAHVNEVNRRNTAILDNKRPWYRTFVTKYHSTKKAALKGGYPHTITVEYLEQLHKEQNGLCALTGIVLTCKEKGIKATSASIDKIDQKKGYVPGNVRFLCHSINSMRLTMSDEEFWDFVDKIKWNRPKKRRIVA